MMRNPDVEFDLQKAIKAFKKLKGMYPGFLPNMEVMDLVNEYWIIWQRSHRRPKQVLIDFARKEHGDTRSKSPKPKTVHLFDDYLEMYLAKDYRWDHPPVKLPRHWYEGLTKLERTVLRLYIETGLSFEKIGKRIGKSEATVLYLYWGIIEYLRAKLKIYPEDL